MKLIFDQSSLNLGMTLRRKRPAIIIVLFLFCLAFTLNKAKAQVADFRFSPYSLSDDLKSVDFDDSFYTKELPSSKVFFMNTPNSLFNQSFLVHESGKTLSSGFSNAQYFRPNYNYVVFGAGTAQQDSFNPYGATDFGSALVSGSVNKLIEILSKGQGGKLFK